MLQDLKNQLIPHSQYFENKSLNHSGQLTTFNKKLIDQQLYSSQFESYHIGLTQLILYCKSGHADQFSESETISRILISLSPHASTTPNNQYHNIEEEFLENDPNAQLESPPKPLRPHYSFQLPNPEDSQNLNPPNSSSNAPFEEEENGLIEEQASFEMPTSNEEQQSITFDVPTENLHIYSNFLKEQGEMKYSSNSIHFSPQISFNKRPPLEAVYLLTKNTNPKSEFVRSQVMYHLAILFEEKTELYAGYCFFLLCRILCNHLSNEDTDPEELNVFYAFFISRLVGLYHEQMIKLNDEPTEESLYEIIGCLRLFVLFLSKAEMISNFQPGPLIEIFFECIQSNHHKLVEQTMKYSYYIARWSSPSLCEFMFNDNFLNLLIPTMFTSYTANNRAPFYSIELINLCVKMKIQSICRKLITEANIFEIDIQSIDPHLRTSFFQLQYHTSLISEDTIEQFLVSQSLTSILELSSSNILLAFDQCRIKKIKFLKCIVYIFFNYPRFHECIMHMFEQDNIFSVFIQSLSIFTSDLLIAAGRSLQILVEIATYNPQNGLIMKLTEVADDIILELENIIDDNAGNGKICEILQSIHDTIQSLS